MNRAAADTRTVDPDVAADIMATEAATMARHWCNKMYLLTGQERDAVVYRATHKDRGADPGEWTWCSYRFYQSREGKQRIRGEQAVALVSRNGVEEAWNL